MLSACRSVQPVAVGCMQPRVAMSVAQHKIVNLLKTLRDFFVVMCHNVFNVWPKTTLLLPVWSQRCQKVGLPLPSRSTYTQFSFVQECLVSTTQAWSPVPLSNAGLTWCCSSSGPHKVIMLWKASGSLGSNAAADFTDVLGTREASPMTLRLINLIFQVFSTKGQQVSPKICSTVPKEVFPWWTVPATATITRRGGEAAHFSPWEIKVVAEKKIFFFL